MKYVILRDFDDDFSFPLKEFIANLQELLDACPPECVDGAEITFDRTGSDYDYSRGELTITRPETEAERIDREQQNAEADIRRVEQSKRDELALLAKLQAKYAGGS
jgi:hypothetical protein